MKKFRMLAVLFLTAFLLSCAGQQKPATISSSHRAAPAALVAAAEPAPTAMLSSVVWIGIRGLGRGSGVIVVNDGSRTLVLTAAHVVRRYAAFGWIFPVSSHVMLKNGMVSKRSVSFGKVVRINALADLALVEIPPGLIAGSAAPVAAADPVYMDHVWVAAAPRGWRASITAGIVSHPNRVRGLYFQTDAHAAPGSSGGPVFNSRGEVVGLIKGGYFGQTIAISRRIVAAFLKGAGVETAAKR